jgi:hypothetical protein
MLQDSALLADGELEFTGDADELRLTRTRDDKKRRPSTIVIPTPHAGLGGASLVVAPDERHVALYIHSGQSEVGLELIALRPRFIRRFSLPYRPGEADPPKFSADATWLAMLVRTRLHAWYDEHGEPHTEGAPPEGRPWTLPWAELYALHLPDRTLSRTEILINAAALPPARELDTWSTSRRLVRVTADAAQLKLPWGERTQLPLPSHGEVIRTYPGPPTP